MLEDDDEEALAEDEEEILVYVEFDGSVAGNTFSNKNLLLDMIGLDTQHPIMQVNGKFYEGTYHDAVGTYMFFEKDNHPAVVDPVFDTIPSIKYCNKSRKVLKMERIFVEPKIEMLGDSNDPDCIPNTDTIKNAGIPPKYQEAAFRSWEDMRNNRMEALDQYLRKQRFREEMRSRGIEPASDSDDDNPFAMYKPRSHVDTRRNKGSKDSATAAHSSRKNELNLISDRAFAEEEESQAPDVMDPEPSTSKNSKPWNSPPTKSPEPFHGGTSDSDSDALHINLPAGVTGKHRATVKVAKRVTTRKYPKVYQNKAKRKDKAMISLGNNDAKEFDRMELDQVEESLVIPDNQLYELFTENTIETQAEEQDAKRTVSEDQAESAAESPLKDDESESSMIEKRKLEKQKKRDEKMKLLSEKFKKAAEESKTKAQESFENSR